MSTDHLSMTFAALADPTRRAILARLASGETTVNQLAEPFDMTLPAITKHLKVLERAGLVARGRAAQWRPCSLRAAPLKEAASWLDAYRQHWEQRLDRLEAYLQTLQSMPVEVAAPSAKHELRARSDAKRKQVSKSVTKSGKVVTKRTSRHKTAHKSTGH